MFTPSSSAERLSDSGAEPAEEPVASSPAEIVALGAAAELARFHDFVEAATDWFWELDADLNYSYVSDSMCRRWGISREDVLGKPRGEATKLFGGYKASDEVMAQHVDDIGNRRPVRDRMFWQELPGGGRAYVSLSALPFFNADGDFLGYRGVTKDVTDAVDDQKRLENNEARLRGVYDAAPVAMAISSADGILVDVNGAYCEMHGYERDELIGRSIQELVHPEDRDLVQTARKRPPTEREFAKPFRRRHLRKDGSVRWGEVHLVFQTDVDGNPANTIAHILDVTEDVRKERELQASEAQFRAAFESTNVGGLICDPQREIVEVNQAYCDMLGYKRDELIGRTPSALVHPDEASGVGSKHAEFGAGAIEHSQNVRRHVHKDGHVVWLSVNAGLVRGDDGHPFQVVAQVIDVTEQKIAEESLRASEDKFRRLFEESKIAKLVRDVDDNIVIANAAFYHLIGYTEDAFAGKKFAEILHPDEVAEHDKVRHLVAQGEMKSLRMERQFIHKDGHIVWVETSVVPHYDLAGEYKYSIGEFQDITERKMAEEALQHSEAQARAFLDATFDRAILLDRDHDIVSLNQAASDQLGAPIHDLVGTNFFGYFPSDRAEQRRRLIDEVFETGVTSFMPPVERDGEWSEGNRRPIFDAEGDVEFVAIFTRDVTEQKQSERAIRGSEMRARAFLDATFDTALLLDRSCTIVELNEMAASRMGKPANELIGTNMLERFPPAFRDDRLKMIEDVFSSGQPDAFQLERSFDDGRWIETNRSPVFGADGEVQFVAVFTRDVTERIEAEHAIVDARDKAENASRAKSQFLAAVSHDLRQPLQSASLLVDMLAEEEPDARRREIFGKVQGSVDALSGLLNAVLEVSRLDAGVVKANVEPVPIHDLIGRVVGEHRTAADENSLKLVARANPVWGCTDGNLLGSVLRILITNAIKFTAEGGVLVGCRRRGDDIRVEIWDTGIGIDRDQHERIFEEYYQVGNQARDRTQGLGLGLAVAERTAQLLGHDIEVRSEPGRGSVFSVTLPAAPLPQAFGADNDATMDPCPSTGTVVVIDDDPAILEVMEMILGDAGHTVICYQDFRKNGTGIDDLFESCAEPPHAILCDYRLPYGLTGLDLIGQIRNKFGVPIPAALLTGELSGTTVRDAQDQDCTVLHKPIAARRLLSLTTALISGHPVSVGDSDQF